MTPEPLLSVRNLRVVFDGRRGALTALDGISFDMMPGEILGVVGESGAGKSLTGTAIIGLLDPPGRASRAARSFRGASGSTICRRRQMRDLRGPHIGAIFQDPLTSLHPLLTVGDQIVETIRDASAVSQGRGAGARAVELLARGRHPVAESAHRPVSRTSSPAACGSAW